MMIFLLVFWLFCTWITISQQGKLRNFSSTFGILVLAILALKSCSLSRQKTRKIKPYWNLKNY